MEKCICLLPLLLSTPAAAQNPQPQNVLFIAVDDLKPVLGCYGNPLAITPNIDSLARDGVVFRRAYCQQAVSGPTRASILSGWRPEQVGVTELDTYIRAKNPDIVTLPQAFREAGYDTRGVGKVFHGSKNSLDEASWSQTPRLYKYSRNEEYQLGKNKTGKKAEAMEFVDAPDSGYFDVKIRNAAIGQLTELSRSGQPFFLAVGFLKPHLPFCAPKRFWDRYAAKDFAIDSADKTRPTNVPEIAYHNSQELRGYTDIPDLGSLIPEQEQELRRGYYACTSFTDEQIGLVIAELKRLGLYDNTLIVLWGDHGYHLGEQDLWGKATTYEAACNAPLIVKGYGKPGTNNDVVEFVDIYPTLIDLCGIATLHPLSGKSLRPLLDGRHRRGSYAVSQFQRPYPALTKAAKRKHMGYVIRDERWAYTEWLDLQGMLVANELYDMSAERFEKKNMAGVPDYKRVERRMAKALHRVTGHDGKGW